MISKFLFVCFVALRHKSTAMVIAGRSVHLASYFLKNFVTKHLKSKCLY